MRLLLLTLALVLLGGQDCTPPEPDPPPGPNPQGGTAYCFGLDYTIWDSVVDGVKGAYNTIIDGEISTNRRSTVRVFFGQAYCTGVAISPHTVLTAAHCGYAATTTHQIRLDGDPEVYQSSEHVFHPDYLSWINAAGGSSADVFDVHGELYDAATGNKYEGVGPTRADGYSAGSLEGRKADLMLLYTDQSLPPPYLSIDRKTYDSSLNSTCFGLVAQGYGRDGAGVGGTLRESTYKITQETDKGLKSVLTDAGKICFGDSGGPLYADVGPGTLYLAGITTTTMSQDCLRGGTHVKVAYPGFKDFIFQKTRP